MRFGASDDEEGVGPTATGDVVTVEPTTLEQRWCRHRWLVDRTTDELGRGRLERAADMAEITAHHATWQHHGAFAAPELERVIAEIASRGLEPVPPHHASPTNVLHIASAVSGLAGLQHMIVRWVAADRHRSHSVALTRQGSTDVPSQLAHAVEQSGGAIHPIGDLTPSTLGRANFLRQLTADYGLLVLHLETEDVVPVLALADAPASRPSLLVNHADHCFWIGAGTADLVVNLRAAGADLSVERRGVESERNAILPTPVDVAGVEATRSEVRAALGVTDESVLLLSVARWPKYEPRDGPHFADLVVPALRRCPDAQLVVAGPTEDDRWRAASDAVGGRIRAIGPRSDAADLMNAADIYVDAFPMTSITSLLEAGSHGLPLVGLDASDDPSGIWTAGAPGLDPVMQRCRDQLEFTETLTTLIDDSTDRRARGDATREAVRSRHTGTGWSEELAAVYLAAEQIGDDPADRRLPPVPRLDGDVDLRVADMMTAIDGVDALYQFRDRVPLHALVPTLWRVWPEDRRGIARKTPRVVIAHLLDRLRLREAVAWASARLRQRNA